MKICLVTKDSNVPPRHIESSLQEFINIFTKIQTRQPPNPIFIRPERDARDTPPSSDTSRDIRCKRAQEKKCDLQIPHWYDKPST